MLTKEERNSRWANGQGYNRYIRGELDSFRKQAWKDQLCGHFPPERKMKILDVGTGPGFFACILAEEGHLVTGIDQSEGMLACAIENASGLGIFPEFCQMDINELAFPDEIFDVLVMRNVTWTLEEPEQVYTEFKRILRPGGMLLIYDANWHMHYFDESMMQKVRQREQRHFEKYGKRELVCNDDVAYFGALPLSAEQRPQWDQRVLSQLGFSVSVTEDVGAHLYEEWEKELYGESPLFEICAIKEELSPEKGRVKNYWQKRAASFGCRIQDEDAEGCQKQLQRYLTNYLPEGSLKVLDAGTGTGYMACVMARMGHEVTGVDLCSNMIEQAKKNAAENGLKIRFFCTDAGELPFSDDTFDVIVSRNVLWALTNPEEVLLQWKRVLKPGGLLLYYDGNHYYYLFDRQALEDRKAYVALTGSAHRDDTGQIDYSEMDQAAWGLPLSRKNRPSQWDETVLPELGYEILGIEEEHPQNLLKEGIAEGYYTSFLMAARKRKEG